MAGKIRANDSSFLPRNTALVLKEAEEAGASAISVVGAQIGAINDRLDGLERQNDRLTKLVELLVKDGGAVKEGGPARQKRI